MKLTPPSQLGGGVPDLEKKSRLRSQFKFNQDNPSMTHLNPTHIRCLYRSLLRELPPLCRKSSAPLHARLRESFASPTSMPALQLEGEQVDQLLTYLRAQRMYTTLLERYNPSLRMETEDRVRLSARRVGLSMPAEWKDEKGN